MASAQSMDLITANEDELFYSNNDQKETRAESILAPSALLPNTNPTTPSVCGKAYFEMNGQKYSCSGSVVNSANRAMVFTAGHCCFDNANNIWATNWIFIPQYSTGSRPYGTFTMRKMVCPPEWPNKNYNFDFALVLMNPDEQGRHAQDVVGGLGIVLDAPQKAPTNSFGYPGNINNAETMSTCAATSAAPNFMVSLMMSYKGSQLPCNMKQGCSGGPWIRQFDPSKRTGYQCSVNSFMHSSANNAIFGPIFNEQNCGKHYRANQNL